MKITAIQPYKNQMFTVEIDSRNRILLHSSQIDKFGLSEGMSLDETSVRVLLNASKKRKAWEMALKYLDYRAHSYYELFSKLNRDFNDDICYETMNKLVQLDMINDRDYAENLARKLVEVKKFGRYRACFEMRRRGLDDDLIDEVLEEYDGDYCDRLRQLVGRKYARQLNMENGCRKVKAALIRQGYSYDEVKQVLESFLDDDFEDEDDSAAEMYDFDLGRS